jgi:hypothetical protein
MLKERFWLAAMQGMQGKYQAALGGVYLADWSGIRPGAEPQAG